jgi:hypothetical protein
MAVRDIEGPDTPVRRDILGFLDTPVGAWSEATLNRIMRSGPYQRRDDPDHELTVNTVSA